MVVPSKRTSASAAPDSEHQQDDDNDNEDSGSKKKRVRYRVACLPCQRKKCKCDGGAPCTSCQQRKCTEKCEYGPVRFKDGTVAQLEYADLKQRVMQFEARLARFDRLFPPTKDEDDHAVSTYQPAPSSSNYQQQNDQDESDNISEGGQAYQNAAETAAVLLEEKTLGREQYGPLGGSRTVILGSLAKPARDSHLDGQASSATPAENGSAFKTSIKNSATSNRARSATSEHIVLSRQRVMAELIEAIPSPDFGEFLVTEFLTSSDWVYKVLHRALLLDEVQQLWACLRDGTAAEIDPAWLAIFFMVLSWPAITDLVRSAAPALFNMSTKEIEAMAHKWRHCAEQALTLADWVGTPQVRVLQALCLLMNFQDGKSAHPTAGSTAFYVWLASAIRIAQAMQLDHADNQSDSWLNDEPAFPPGPSGIKRETCRRIWSLLLVSDWVFNSHGGRPSIAPGSFTIADPKRVNDEDLGRSLEYTERPAHELTDIDFFTVRLGLARFQVAVNAFWGNSTKTYQMILDLDTLLERSLAEVPPTMQTNNAYSKPHHRSVSLCVLHNRRLRLHRPFLIRGLRNPTSRYAYSAQQCIHSASTICEALDDIVDAQKLDLFWYTHSQALAAVICLFVDHFHKIMTRPDNVKMALSSPSIGAAKRFYQAGLNSTVASVVQAARRGQTVLDTLCQYEDELRQDSASYSRTGNVEETLTAVLQRAAELVETAGIESAAASPIAAPVFLSDFLALDTYSGLEGNDSDLLVQQSGSMALYQDMGAGLPLQNNWLGNNSLVDWNSLLTDPGLFGP